MIEVYLAQFGLLGDGGISQVVWFLGFMALIFLYPKLMIAKAVWEIESKVEKLESMTEDSVDTLIGEMKRKPTESFRQEVTSFLDFFMNPPADMDPNGIVSKLDKAIKSQFNEFEHFVAENADTKDEVERENLQAALINTTGMHQITKMVRHFLGLVKKYKNAQIAMLIKMQLPMIMDMAEAVHRSVDNMIEGIPVGDGVGPLAAAELTGHVKYEEMGDIDMTYATRKIADRDVVISKAKGPGAAIGYPGDALKELIEEHEPSRVISIDASGKLEGEETGKVAEGVGFVINPQIGGTQQYEVEEIAEEMDIPLDAVIVKMSQEESMQAMNEDIYNAVPEVIERVEKKVKRAGTDETVMIVGIGNTVGVGNNKKELENITEEKLQQGFEKLERIREEEEEDRPFWKRSS